MSDRVPPNNVEAERAVLGACLIDEEAFEAAREALTADDFYDHRHREAFTLMQEIAMRNVKVDMITFRDEIKKRSMEAILGGSAFIATLADSVTTTANIEYHIDIVRDRSIHRAMIVAGNEIVKMGYSEDKEVKEALEEAEQKVFDLARTGRTENLRSTSTVVRSAMEEIERRLASGRLVTGIPTGFDEFDNCSTGLQPGGLYILAARPSMGKTALAINIAQNAAILHNIPVIFFSLEMSAEQIVQRMLSSVAKVNILEMFRTGKQQNNQWNDLTSAAGKIERSPFYIDDSSPLNTMELRSRCRRFFAKQPGGTGLIVVDYLQLLYASRKIENRTQEVTEISRSLKSIAREFKAPVLALSQLSREVEKREKKRPQLSDLRESGSIEQDADMVMFLYRDEYYNPEANNATADLIIAKNRNGETGTVPLVFFKECSRFEKSYIVR